VTPRGQTPGRFLLDIPPLHLKIYWEILHITSGSSVLFLIVELPLRVLGTPPRLAMFRGRARKAPLAGRVLQVGAFTVRVGEGALNPSSRLSRDLCDLGNREFHLCAWRRTPRRTSSPLRPLPAAFAEGGTGSIYSAVDQTTGEEMAVKHVNVMGDDDIRASVQGEVGALLALSGQPGIVRLLSHSFIGPREAEQAVLLLEFCPRSLVQHIHGGAARVPESEKLAIFRAVCEGVGAMHGQDPPLTHRDIKAENVLQRADGRWVLCDFGSVSTFHGALGSADAVARQGTLVQRMTTPGYRSPELWDLYQGQVVGPKSDVWALGCLLYWMLSDGTALPFEGAKMAVIGARYPPLPGASRGAQSLVRAALCKDPERRPDVFSLLLMVEAAMRDPSAAAADPTSAPASRSETLPVRPAPPSDRAAPVASHPAERVPAPARQGPGGLFWDRQGGPAADDPFAASDDGDEGAGADVPAPEGESWATFESPLRVETAGAEEPVPLIVVGDGPGGLGVAAQSAPRPQDPGGGAHGAPGDGPEDGAARAARAAPTFPASARAPPDAAVLARVSRLSAPERDALLARMVADHRQMSSTIAVLSQQLARQGAILAGLTGGAGLGGGAGSEGAAAAGFVASTAEAEGKDYDARVGFTAGGAIRASGGEGEDGFAVGDRLLPTLRGILQHRRARSDLPHGGAGSRGGYEHF